jgi:hypothetical protein
MIFGLIGCMFDCLVEFFAKRRQRKASNLCKAALKAEGECEFTYLGSIRTRGSFSDDLKSLIRIELALVEKEKAEAEVEAKANCDEMIGLRASINRAMYDITKVKPLKKKGRKK